MEEPSRSDRERDLLREITELTAGRPRARGLERSAPPRPAKRPDLEAPDAPATEVQEKL